MFTIIKTRETSNCKMTLIDNAIGAFGNGGRNILNEIEHIYEDIRITGFFHVSSAYVKDVIFKYFPVIYCNEVHIGYGPVPQYHILVANINRLDSIYIKKHLRRQEFLNDVNKVKRDLNALKRKNLKKPVNMICTFGTNTLTLGRTYKVTKIVDTGKLKVRNDNGRTIYVSPFRFKLK
jgi:hypothetical protein